MKQFVKIVNPGKVEIGGRLREMFVEIRLKESGELTMHGVVGPWHSGNCAGSSGQCDEALEDISVFHKGWSKAKVQKLRLVWNDWHLHHMRPRCIHQAGWDVSRMLEMSDKEKRAAGWVTPDEHPDGLLGKPCPVCGYAYGTAWNKESVPVKVLDWLQNLPDTAITPAWV
jgi:hypothetical protein